MDQRVNTYSEYAISSSVSDVRNIESQTLSVRIPGEVGHRFRHEVGH
jgi:hypothetical protein